MATARAGAIPPKQQARRSGGTEPRRGPPVGGPQTGEGSAQGGGVLEAEAMEAATITIPYLGGQHAR